MGKSPIIEGSLEVKLPTIWTDEKQSRAEAERRERLEERRVEEKEIQKIEDAGARKGRKVAKHCVFPMICGSGGSKSRLAKAAGAEPAGQMRAEKLHAGLARSTFPSEKVQNTWVSEHFWKLRCRKSCTPLWREAHFRSEMYKTPQCRPTFWKLRCRKSACRCGAKHISKSTCTKTHHCGTTFWKLRCPKKCTPLWREAHFQVKMHKTHHCRTTFGT